MEKIWSFADNEAVENEKVDMKPFAKPTGRFFEDVATLTKIFNVKTHPGLREKSYRQSEDAEHNNN